MAPDARPRGSSRRRIDFPASPLLESRLERTSSDLPSPSETDTVPGLPLIWGQITITNPGTADALAILALRRWYESLSLTSPRPEPSAVPFVAWLAGLASAFGLALFLQGPRRAIGQFLDVRGHVRLLQAAILRLRNAARMVAVLFGLVVVAWTTGQFAHYNDPGRLEDLYVITATRSLFELAVDLGVLAAIVPLRDLIGLGDLILLLVAATILVFKLSADRWGGIDNPYDDIENPLPYWVTPCWVAAWLYAMYRFASLIVPDTGGLPWGIGFFPEILVVPLFMALADGIILAWVLVELRNATLTDSGVDTLDVRGAVALWPAAVLACVAVLPARYVATATWLALNDLPTTLTAFARPLLAALVDGWGLVALQSAALATTALVGGVAWCGGGVRAAVHSYLGLVRVEGGRVVALLMLAGAASGALTALATLVVLSLPKQPWLLAAADSYAHYATLPIGLITLAALVELGMRALPRATVAELPVVAEAETAVI